MRREEGATWGGGVEMAEMRPFQKCFKFGGHTGGGVW